MFSRHTPGTFQSHKSDTAATSKFDIRTDYLNFGFHNACACACSQPIEWFGVTPASSCRLQLRRVANQWGPPRGDVVLSKANQWGPPRGEVDFK